MTILISADVEASGPCPGMGDLAMFALVAIEPGLTRRFSSGLMRAECERYNPSAYMFGVAREQHLAATATIAERMVAMVQWLDGLGSSNGRYVMVSDNPGFDFGWLNWALWTHTADAGGRFGHSARRIGDVYAGLRQRPRDTSGWKRYRKTPHTHDPLDDALGNAEAWLEMWARHGTTREALEAGVPRSGTGGARP